MNTLRHRAHIALFAAALAVTPGLTHGQNLNPAGRPFPNLQLPASARGVEVVNALGGRLPEVAAFYGKSAAELRAILLRDRSLWADRSGRLHYVCDALPQAGVTGGAAENTVAAGPFPADQTFLLHSRPGATRVIYLDFNGHVTSGTSWNTAYESGADFATPPFDIDGIPGSFSATELDRIQYIWQRVAEDFAPFGVDVTTEDPGAEALRRSGSTDASYGIRVCIGGSSLDWYGNSAGGVAYIGSFTSSLDTPCYVFTAQLGNGGEKYVAEACSHEAGHTLGLHHDGKTDGTTYYQGHGDWAPIMGNSYYKNITQWSRGEYPLANNTEDDLAIVAGYVGYRPDDHGNFIGAATPIAGTSVSASGVIERTSDADVFSFNTGAGMVSFNLTGAPRSGNLDALLALYDGLGNLVISTNSTGLNASLSTSVFAGTYYLLVDGAGAGDLTTGYSDYASLGQYTLNGTVQNPVGASPTAVAAASPAGGSVPLTVGFSSAGSFDSDGTIVAYDWNFGDGGTSTDPNPVHTYTTTGTFTATLVVRDNDDLTGVASVVVTVSPPPNEPPVAAASATPVSGTAPLVVAFSSAGSLDPDGSLSAYSWNFGNGATSTAPNPSYTYVTAGTYVATLVVTDNQGAKATNSVTVTVAPDPNAVVFVSNIAMSLVVQSSGNSGRAVVTVRDAAGNARPGATVTGNWSGLVTGISTGTTDAGGNVTLTSKKTRKKGTFTFTVTGVAAAGYSYNSSRNVETTDSVVNP